MWILPVAMVQALLPAMASAYATQAQATAGLLRRGGLLVLTVVLPPCLLLVAFGPELLRLWLGAEFAAGSGRVLQILAVGIFFSCAAFAPGALLDAIGRPQVNALWQLAQAAVFLPLSALLLLWAGIEGAAAAWALRCATDAAGRLFFAGRFYPAAAGAARILAWPVLAGGVGLVALLAFDGTTTLVGVGALALAVFVGAAFLALTPAERADARGLLRRPWRIRAVLRGETA
jgi:O-antigen/teichoic acid export membrane protein